jgi:hypothetical protein
VIDHPPLQESDPDVLSEWEFWFPDVQLIGCACNSKWQISQGKHYVHHPQEWKRMSARELI